jgi:hypothetical protein
MTATENILLPEEIIDTYKLQFKSLTEFMRGLNYEYEGRLFGSPHFVSYDYENKARKSISVHTACLLHNNAYSDWHGKDFKAPFDFSHYKIRKAKAAKIVNIVNIQLNKKTGHIRTTSNLVNFVDKAYEYMLYSKYL